MHIFGAVFQLNLQRSQKTVGNKARGIVQFCHDMFNFFQALNQCVQIAKKTVNWFGSFCAALEEVSQLLNALDGLSSERKDASDAGCCANEFHHNELAAVSPPTRPYDYHDYLGEDDERKWPARGDGKINLSLSLMTAGSRWGCAATLLPPGLSLKSDASQKIQVTWGKRTGCILRTPRPIKTVN